MNFHQKQDFLGAQETQRDIDYKIGICTDTYIFRLYLTHPSFIDLNNIGRWSGQLNKYFTIFSLFTKIEHIITVI